MEKSAKKSCSKLDICPEDIETLVAHPDCEVRAIQAMKICRKVRTLKLSPREERVVEKIFTLMSQDAAAMVRRALAVTLKNSPNLPHKIAKKLIHDIDSIAVPILEHSPVLTDEDLREILRSKAAAKMLAITKRPRLTGDLVKAVLRYGDSHIVASVAANDGAEIGPKLGAHMLELYQNDDLIKESFIARRELPPLVLEKLMSLVSSNAAKRLVEKHKLPVGEAVDLANRARERAQATLVGQKWMKDQLPDLVRRLHREGRLTNGLIVRAAACGQMHFTALALAARAEIGYRKAVLMLHDSGPLGLTTLGQQAGLGQGDFVLLRAAVEIFHDLERSGQIRRRSEFKKLMLERVSSLPLPFSDADQDYFLEKLDAVA